MAKTKGKTAGSPDVVFIRVSKELARRLDKVVEACGASKNAIGEVALERIVAAAEHAMEVEEDSSIHPDEVFEHMDRSAVRMLIEAKVAGPRLRIGWERAMVEWEREETEQRVHEQAWVEVAKADKSEREARKGKVS